MSASERAKAAKQELDKESTKTVGDNLADSSKSDTNTILIPEVPTATERKLSASQEEYFQDFNSAKVVSDYVSELLRNTVKSMAIEVINGELKGKVNNNISKEVQVQPPVSPKEKNNNIEEDGVLKKSFNGDGFVSDCVNTAKSRVKERRVSEKETLSE